MKNILYTLLFAFVIFFGAGVVANFFTMSDDSLVITFVGILATFVVIGNYSQVHNLTENTNKNIDKLEKRLSKINDETLGERNPQSLKNKLQYISDTLIDKNGKSQVSNIQTRLGNLERAATHPQQNILLYMQLRDILYLEIGEHKKLVKDIILNPNAQQKRNIKRKKNNETIEAYLFWSNEKGIQCKDADGNPIDDVISVASKPFDKIKIDKILRNLLIVNSSSMIQ